MTFNNQSASGFNLERYLGKWYQIATIPSWFQKNLVNVTAEYSLKSDRNIKVFNRGINKNTLKESSITGTAKVPNLANPSALKVSFFFFPADYIVLAFDPDYQWALVGGADRNTLWVLSRTPTMPDELYNQIFVLALDRGYNVAALLKT